MYEAYDRILWNIREKFAAKAHKAFQWLAFSERPLYIEEVAEAAILDSQGSLHGERFTDPYEIVDLCSSLVILAPATKNGTEREHLGFAHHTVKEYLLSSMNKSPMAAAFSFSEFDAQNLISHACLSYLLSWMQTNGTSAGGSLRPPLLEYAASYWYSHLNTVRTNRKMSHALAILAVQLFDARSRDTLLNGLSTLITDVQEGPEAMQPDSSGISSSLYYASLLGLEEVVAVLLERGDEVNKTGGFCGTPLQAAASGCHAAVVHQLMDYGAIVDLSPVCGYYGSALQAAAHGGHKDTVRMLLAGGSDINFASGVYGSALQAAAIGGFADQVELLVEHGADVNAVGGMHGNALIASARGAHKSVVIILLDNGADINAREAERNSTALYAAASLGHCEVVSLLLERGANSNAVGGEFGNALKAAAHGGFDDVVQVLVRFGASTSAKGSADHDTRDSALHMAVSNGHEAVAKLLLRRRSVDADMQDEDGLSPLMKAACNGHAKIAQLLLEKGANTRTTDSNGGTALMMAAEGGHEEVARLLLRRGAEAWATNKAGQSPLQIAKSKGHHRVIKLLEDEASLDHRDSKGPTRRTTGSTLEEKREGTVSTPAIPIEQTVERAKSLLAELQSLYSSEVEQSSRDQPPDDLEELLQMMEQQTSSSNLGLRFAAARKELQSTLSLGSDWNTAIEQPTSPLRRTFSSSPDSYEHYKEPEMRR